MSNFKGTVKQFAEVNEIENGPAQLFLSFAVSKGWARVIGEAPKAENQRGRAAKIYEVRDLAPTSEFDKTTKAFVKPDKEPTPTNPTRTVKSVEGGNDDDGDDDDADNRADAKASSQLLDKLGVAKQLQGAVTVGQAIINRSPSQDEINRRASNARAREAVREKNMKELDGFVARLNAKSAERAKDESTTTTAEPTEPTEQIKSAETQPAVA